MKRRRIHLINIVLLALAITGCKEQEPQHLSDDVIHAMQLHFNQNDPVGTAELFTDDGAIMSEFGETVQGKPAIANYLQGEIKKQLQYWLTSEGNEVSGNIAYDFGTLRIRDTNRGVDLESAKYMVIYKKVNGEWKIYRNIYNTNSLAACASVQITPEATP